MDNSGNPGTMDKYKIKSRYERKVNLDLNPGTCKILRYPSDPYMLQALNGPFDYIHGCLPKHIFYIDKSREVGVSRCPLNDLSSLPK